MSEEEDIVTATPSKVIAVIEQVPELSWPRDDEWLKREIDGLEVHTNYLCHVLALAATKDKKAMDKYVASIREHADKRWHLRHHFDATRFTDDKSTDRRLYDRRSAPAALIRSIGAGIVPWWTLGEDAVVLASGQDEADGLHKAVVLVLSKQWLVTGRGKEEEALERTEQQKQQQDQERSEILDTVWAVTRTRDPEVLAPLADSLSEIRRRSAGVDLGGALASNASHLEHALRRLELFRDGQCLCAAYPDHSFYDTDKEITRGHVRQVGIIPNDGRWYPERVVECADCGQLFQVACGEYHYTWWKWTQISTVPEGLQVEADAAP